MFFSELKIPKTYYLIDNMKQLSWLKKELLESSEFAFDIETTFPTTKSKDKVEKYLSNNEIKVAGISFAWGRKKVENPWKPNLSAYIPLITWSDKDFWKSNQNKVIETIKEILESPIYKVAHNGKFDCGELFKFLDIKTANFRFDTMLAKSLLDEDSNYCSGALKSKFDKSGNITKLGCSDYYLNMGSSEWKKDLDDALDHYDPSLRRYHKIPLDILYPYACADSDLTLSIKMVLDPLLAKENLSWVFNNITMNLSHSLMLQEINGMPISMENLHKWSAEQQQIMSDTEKEIWDLVGEKFDVASNSQLGVILFEKLQLGGGTKGKTGYVVDEAVLKEIDHPISKLILKYRKALKLDSTYLQGNLKHIREYTHDGRFGWVHSSYFIPSKTSRLRSNSPNITNVTKRDVEKEEKTGELSNGYYARGIYVAPEGYKFLLTDYSNFELRLAAEVSGEPEWIQNYIEGTDLHSRTAKKVFNLDCTVDEVKKIYPIKRKQAKMVNFAILYGSSDYGLSQSLGVPLEEAQQIIEDYFSALPVLKNSIDMAHDFVKTYGYLTNKFGRRRHLPDAMLKVPKRSFYRRDEVPSCYRNTVAPYQIGLTTDDIHRVSHIDISNGIFNNNLKNFYKCRNCNHLSSCFINSEAAYINRKINRTLRQSFNFLVQSLASDCAHIAHFLIMEELKGSNMRSTLNGYVHDEFIALCPDEEVEHVQEIFERCMVDKISELLNARVPITVDHSVKQCWGDDVG
jgi:DNA polymerase I-like protein with 3'-5' exonuclease and polymerase domains